MCNSFSLDIQIGNNYMNSVELRSTSLKVFKSASVTADVLEVITKVITEEGLDNRLQVNFRFDITINRDTADGERTQNYSQTAARIELPLGFENAEKMVSSFETVINAMTHAFINLAIASHNTEYAASPQIAKF